MLFRRIKVFHGHENPQESFRDFLDKIGQTLKDARIAFSLHAERGELFYGASVSDGYASAVETQFYSSYPRFQLESAIASLEYDPERTIIAEISLENREFFPLKYQNDPKTEFIYRLFRTFENLDISRDRAAYVVDVQPIVSEGMWFYIVTQVRKLLFRLRLLLTFFRYVFNYKIQKNWKSDGYKYFSKKLDQELFRTRLILLVEGADRIDAEAKARTIFHNFLIYDNYPQNRLVLRMLPYPQKGFFTARTKSTILSSEELSSLFHFPYSPTNETALVKVKSAKFSPPTGIPTIPGQLHAESGEIIPKPYDGPMQIIGISDYRSTRVPIAVYDEDRLRHTYVIGKTGVGKSKLLEHAIASDLARGHGVGLIDPHGDLVEEVLMRLPESRIEDVIIFDPTDTQYPFCFNPLDVRTSQSRQILAKGFIDIFRKFFGANWNAKLEHVLRMVFLGLLDTPGSTLFDIIRALTDRDHRYHMVEHITDDVVRNFWTNEFAAWSQQFNTEAIMPILNKVGQLLSVDMLKNIFTAKESKLDFFAAMQQKKILIIKLPKWQLQEEIMGFLGAMFVTKLFQSAMSRQGMDKSERTPFFLYIDEFQNFATDTFGEILSEARKYGLGLTVAHQYLSQMPDAISRAIFGNVGTLMSFRVASDDALILEKHLTPFVTAYDLANLDAREFYCKTLVKWQSKDPMSLRTVYTPDAHIRHDVIADLYALSRARYARPLEEAKTAGKEQHQSVIETLGNFSEPLL